MKSLPNKILIASNNKGKIKEISDLLSELNIEAIIPSSLSEFQDFEEPEETGANFQENSLIKAKFYALKSGLTALADDSGLCLEALDNQPGIHSARFSLDESGQKNFPHTFQKIFEMLKNKGLDLQKDEIKAHFICNLTLFDPKSEFSISFEGRVDGKITEPKGNKGFGYDPIFIKNAMTQTFGEIEAAQKDKISHRADAFDKLKNWLSSIK